MNRPAFFILICILLAFAACFFVFKEKQPKDQEVAVECGAESFGALRLESGNFAVFEDGNGAGKASIHGKIISEERVIWEDPVNVVYMELSPSDSVFQDYFHAMTLENNSVNVVKDGNLLFKLGAIDGGKFSSTAAVSASARKKIETALAGGQSVSLSVEVPVYAGGGAPDNFSFACAINS